MMEMLETVVLLAMAGFAALIWLGVCFGIVTLVDYIVTRIRDL